MKYAHKKGRYQANYEVLYKEHVEDTMDENRTSHPTTLIGMFIRIISNLYNDIIHQPNDVIIVKEDFEFMDNFQYHFKMIGKDELFSYFMTKYFEQYFYCIHRLPTDFDAGEPTPFTHTLDEMVDTIIEAYGVDTQMTYDHDGQHLE